MIKMAEAFWIEGKVIFTKEGDEFLDDYHIVKITFQTALKGGDRYVISRKGRELDKLLREMNGAAVKGNIFDKLRSCRKKPVLLVISCEGNFESVQAVLPRNG